jgi:4-amino-4-deoxy-L-arabinose transferase-like glycosyltransferase
MTQTENRLFYLFLAGWTLLNLLQAGGTGLDPDEAYYWMYARNLDWGYFDHPPAIALMIKTGYALFSNALGVRLLTVLFQTGAFYFLWELAGRPRNRLLLFVLLLAAMPLLEVYGFIATPDGPLLFFTVLFFLFYRRFREHDSWFNTLVLGVCMAALLYSKYHGILVIGFTALSSRSLWRHPRFYMASAFGALLFMPHLYWQYAHDFPSFRYHLQGRDDPYELKHTLTYLLNQPVVFNPLLFPLFLIALFRKKRPAFFAESALERAFYFVITGFWVFFFWTTFKGHNEPQWTAVLSVPLLLIAFWYAEENVSYRQWLKVMAMIGILILMIARSIILFGWVDFPGLHFQKEDWPELIRKTAGGQPVLFVNSYRDPSVYAYYTGEEAYAYSTVGYRANQYNIWARETALQGRRVLVAAPVEEDCFNCFPFVASGIKKNLFWADSLQVFHQLKVNMEKDGGFKGWQAWQRITLNIYIQNPYDYPIELEKGSLPLKPAALFQYAPEQWTFARGVLGLKTGAIPSRGMVNTTFSFSVPSGLNGACDFGIGFQLGRLSPSLHSPLMKVHFNGRKK